MRRRRAVASLQTSRSILTQFLMRVQSCRRCRRQLVAEEEVPSASPLALSALSILPADRRLFKRFSLQPSAFFSATCRCTGMGGLFATLSLKELLASHGHAVVI